jgi:uncharacterized protein (DUF1800 family)
MRNFIGISLLPLLLAAPLSAQMAPSALDSARHALNRLGYGPTPGQVEAVAREGVLRWMDRQLDVREVRDPALASREAGFAVLQTSRADMVALHTDQVTKALRAQAQGADSATIERMRMQARAESKAGDRDLRTLNAELQSVTLLRAVASERQLGEVLADFWINHFNVYIAKGFDRAYFADYLERTIRPNALGRFEDLLVATATSPAMLFYLDNAQSVADNTAVTAQATRRPAANRPVQRPGQMPRPGAPARPGQRGQAMDPAMVEQIRARMPRGLNENYARELLELHTLGVDGGYAQEDVIHVARILTGWTIDRRGDHGFQFLPAAHDRSAKVVLGRTFPAGGGEAEGRALLAMLAAHPATMHHVSAKLCARFVADAAPDGCIDDAVRAWKRSDGSIREVVRAIVHSPDFWAGSAMQAKTKTPLEFVVSAVRAIGGTPDATPRLAQQLQRLGQPLFQQVTPNGYPETSAEWVNSGALLARMTFAVALASNRLPGVSVQLDGLVPATANHEILLDAVNRAILGGAMTARTRDAIRAELREISDPRAARAMAVGLALGGPEFQRQ